MSELAIPQQQSAMPPAPQLDKLRHKFESADQRLHVEACEQVYRDLWAHNFDAKHVAITSKRVAFNRLDVEDVRVAATLAAAWVSEPQRVGQPRTDPAAGDYNRDHEVNLVVVGLILRAAFQAWSADDPVRVNHGWSVLTDGTSELAEVNPSVLVWPRPDDIAELWRRFPDWMKELRARLARVGDNDQDEAARFLSACTATLIALPTAVDELLQAGEEPKFGIPSHDGGLAFVAQGSRKNWRKELPLVRPELERAGAVADAYLQALERPDLAEWVPQILGRFPFYSDYPRRRSNVPGPLPIAELLKSDANWIASASEALTSSSHGEQALIADAYARRLHEMAVAAFVSPSRNEPRVPITLTSITSLVEEDQATETLDRQLEQAQASIAPGQPANQLARDILKLTATALADPALFESALTTAREALRLVLGAAYREEDDRDEQ